MESRVAGIYNFKTAIDVHIPSLGAQSIADKLHNRLPVVKPMFNDVLLQQALQVLVDWKRSGKRFSSYTSKQKVCIWNAYAMATFDRDSLRNAIVENGQIRYKDDVPVDYTAMTSEELIADEHGSDHWDGTGCYK
tara:strand:- start:211 stop:615 length:405 start_codon:yes stop_codon:yes gene_type:complete